MQTCSRVVGPLRPGVRLPAPPPQEEALPRGNVQTTGAGQETLTVRES